MSLPTRTEWVVGLPLDEFDYTGWIRFSDRMPEIGQFIDRMQPQAMGLIVNPHMDFTQWTNTTKWPYWRPSKGKP